MTLVAGVASIKGTYQGDVAADRPGAARCVHVARLRRRCPGHGAAPTCGSPSPSDDGSTTRLEYDADAIVGGMIGGVGQRVLSGVAKKTAGEFFKAVDDVLTGKAPSVPAPRHETEHPVAVPAGTGTVFSGPPLAAATVGSEFLKGAVFGAVVALAGVLVGGLVTRRHG